jgi:nucleotide-binding universal stress UspA family protein
MGLELDHVLVPVDFGPSTDYMIDRAIALAADYRADLTLLHVVVIPFFGFAPGEAEAEELRASELLRALVQGRVRELRRLHAWRGVAMTEVFFGSPAEEIVDAASRLEAKAIVIGLPPQSTLAHAVTPSTTDRVLRRASCPVIVVPTSSRTNAEPSLEETAIRWGLAA